MTDVGRQPDKHGTNGHKRTLVVRYDVSGLEENAIGALMLEAKAQGEASDDHPDVDVEFDIENDDDEEPEPNVFVVEVRALAERLWELRRDYQPENRGPESPSATLSSRLLASFASYLSCVSYLSRVADGSDLDEEALQGLVRNIRADITTGIEDLTTSRDASSIKLEAELRLDTLNEERK